MDTTWDKAAELVADRAECVCVCVCGPMHP